MIRILPMEPDRLAALCREKEIDPGDAPLRGYAAADGEETLGWCLAADGEPCLILGEEAEDPQVGDGLLRAVLFPFRQAGRKGYRFARPPKGPLPAGYALAGEGSLGELFTPCSERRKNP